MPRDLQLVKGVICNKADEILMRNEEQPHVVHHRQQGDRVGHWHRTQVRKSEFPL